MNDDLYGDLEACTDEGVHLTLTDEDGYCVHCGYDTQMKETA